MRKWQRLGFEKRLESVRRGADECWVWDGAHVAKKGYGVFRRGKQLLYAHRTAYERMVGPIPDGMELDHLCNNPPCCNPAHLEPVTHAENMRRYGARRTHCARGHDLTTADAYFHRANGKRECRVCKNEQHQRWAEAHPGYR